MARNTSGYNGLFIPGPTNVPDKVRQALNVPMQDMRASDFGELTFPLFAGVKKVLRTQTAEVFLFPASGTGGWEATVANLFSPGDRVLMSSFGQFSMLWVDMCERFGLEVEHCAVEWGLGVPHDEYRRILEADKAHTIKGVFACHNETATGVTSDIAAIRAILDDLGHPALLCVDGVSSLGSLEFRMDDWGVDVIVGGSQKGFMLPAGLTIMGVSQKAMERRVTATMPRTFFSFDDMLKHNATGHFPYTPPTQLFHGLQASLKMMFEEGLDNIVARHNRLATAVRAGVHAWGLELCAKDPATYSDTVSAIVVPEHMDSGAVLKAAYERYNLSLGAGLSKVAGKVFRIGHLGNLNEIMVLQALAGSEMAMRDSGINIELGSGVAAAQACFIQSADEQQISRAA
ncbi:aminotransferase class V-fold PLP-dependent enzyme [Pseudahrensia aquimaris]|uniref:Aminotransferase class V-fold PLP-dependent enzyme n=1 Tax=Pseudahrensia aquimaris TaxID=744461 RepID=A0ABW3FDU4_9HYPH